MPLAQKSRSRSRMFNPNPNPKRKRVKHFHLIAGNYSSTPMLNLVMPTRDAAEFTLKEIIRDVKKDGVKVSGSYQQGKFQILNPEIFPVEYIEIVECTNPDHV